MDCPLCRTGFKNAKALRQHKERIHYPIQEMKAFGSSLATEDLGQECQICGEKFLTENILNYHRLYSHNLRQRAHNSALTNFMTIFDSLK